jgi:Rieske Fe-S protein
MPDIDRRTVIASAGILTAAGALAACGASDAADTSTAPPAPTPPASQAPISGVTLFPAGEVPIGGGRVDDAQQVVVTQPMEGQFRGFSAICTHAGCLVTEVQDNEILCPCHGSLFSAEDGSVIRGPATEPLPPAQVGIADGNVVLGQA